MSQRAGELARSALSGDSAAVMSYVSAREMREEGLDEHKVREIMDKLILPYLKPSWRTAKTESGDSTGDWQGVFGIYAPSTRGQIVPLGFEVYKYPEGIKTMVLDALLTASWYLRFGPAKSEGQVWGDWLRAYALGLEADEVYLESIGLRGLSAQEEGQPFRTWSEIKSRVAQKVGALSSG
jgi:hypothetical protein